MANKAIIIAGTQSGSGKTTVTLGLMAALAKRGLKVQPFKCGPDFIDPTLHKLVTGTTSRNLDIWMSGEDFTRQTFARHGRQADISVIEGVMGMFDGGESSSAALAAKLGVPVVLVLDVRSAAESAAAVLKGFESLEPEVAPVGVILNMVASDQHLQLVSEAIKKHCRAEILGYLPRSLTFKMPQRHLGLHMGDEAPINGAAIAELTETIETYVDLDRLLVLAGEPRGKRFSETSVATDKHEPGEKGAQKVRIAVAWDAAFCFYYEDNLDILRRAGAELVFFSPLADRQLPVGIDAIYLGGGYPELHAEALGANKSMLVAIKKWAENNGPVYGECGGFMYLTQGIFIADKFHPMVDIFPVKARMQNKRAALGYREIKLKSDCLLGRAGNVLRGHEFHYSNISDMPAGIARLYAVNNDTEEGYSYKNVLGGYLHLHFGFNPGALIEFVEKLRTTR